MSDDFQLDNSGNLHPTGSSNPDRLARLSDVSSGGLASPLFQSGSVIGAENGVDLTLSGGTGSAGTYTYGGNVIISAGSAGSGTYTYGGQVTILGGDGNAYSGGDVYISGGSNYYSKISITNGGNTVAVHKDKIEISTTTNQNISLFTSDGGGINITANGGAGGPISIIGNGITITPMASSTISLSNITKDGGGTASGDLVVSGGILTLV